MVSIICSLKTTYSFPCWVFVQVMLVLFVGESSATSAAFPWTTKEYCSNELVEVIHSVCLVCTFFISLLIKKIWLGTLPLT